MRAHLRIHTLYVGLAFALAACSGHSRGDDASGGAGAGDGTGTSSGGGSDGGGIRLDVGNGTGGPGDESDGCEDKPSHNATLRGTVFTPNLEIPISGALVYVTDEDPEPIPDGVYCAECVKFDCAKDFTLTEPDGSFTLTAVAGENRKLVVQKGQFLHITNVDILEGTTDVPPDDSKLPGQWDPAAGHYIPRIAVFEIYDDAIFNVLAKIGLGEVDNEGQLVQGTEQFDIFGNWYGDENGHGWNLLDEEGDHRFDKYHIIFIPCMSQDSIGPPTLPGRVDRIRSWVERGGKWYVTDWANEYHYVPFPSYITMYDQYSEPDLGDYESVATVLDPDFLAWLEALPDTLKDIGGGLPTLFDLPDVELIDNWSGIEEIHDVIVQNDEGEDVNVGPYPWIEGPCPRCYPDTERARPMTTTSEYGCGRMMFSTVHTNDDSRAHNHLSPQELVLLYIILEIGVCFDEPPPPPPPQG